MFGKWPRIRIKKGDIENRTYSVLKDIRDRFELLPGELHGLENLDFKKLGQGLAIKVETLKTKPLTSVCRPSGHYGPVTKVDTKAFLSEFIFFNFFRVVFSMKE